MEILAVVSFLGIWVSLALLVISLIKKKNRKKWASTMGICIVVFLFAATIHGMELNKVDSTDSSDSDTPPAQSAHEIEDQSQQADTEPVEEPEDEQNQGNAIGIDGTVSADCFDLSIVDVKWTTALETSLGTITPDDAEKGLLCIIFSAKNTTDSVQNVASIGFNAYADWKKVIPKVVVGGIDDAVVFVGAVSPGMEIVGHVVWELPLDWEEFQTSYIDAGTAVDSKQHFVIKKSDIE